MRRGLGWAWGGGRGSEERKERMEKRRVVEGGEENGEGHGRGRGGE